LQEHLLLGKKIGRVPLDLVEFPSGIKQKNPGTSRDFERRRMYRILTEQK